MKDKLTFSISVIGDETKQRFEGEFEVKTKLSIRDQLREDEVQRNILGANASQAGMLATQIADAIAYLAVRVTKSPAWWTAPSCSGGLDLQDTNVLVAVNNGAVKALADETEAETKKVAAAQAELKQHATTAQQ